MTDREALLATIVSHPHDDFPRLIMAEWLEEHGEAERAEFIRIQCELARTMRPCPTGIANAEVGYRHTRHSCFMCSEFGGVVYDCDNPKELRRRERELLVGSPSETWGANAQFEGMLSDLGFQWEDPQTDPRWTFRRGLIDSLTLAWSDFLRHERALIWSPGKTDECPDCTPWCRANGITTFGHPTCKLCSKVCVECGGEGQVDDPDHPDSDEHGVDCIGCLGRGKVSGTGRIPRPFPATAQPITRVRLTTWPDGWYLPDRNTLGAADGYRFERVNCATCNGTNRVTQPHMDGTATTSPCTTCRGEPLNSWTCPAWPGVVFTMPVAEPSNDAADALAYARLAGRYDDPLYTPVQHR